MREVRRWLSLGAAVLVLGLRFSCGQYLTMFPRLVLEATLLLGVYVATLLYVMGQRSFYMDLLRKMSGRSSVAEVPTQ